MELYDVVSRLIGPTKPIGETGEDERRFSNLQELSNLVDCLIVDLDSISQYKRRQEYSMKKAGEYASKALDDLGIKE